MFLGSKISAWVGTRVRTRGFADSKLNGKNGQITGTTKDGKFEVNFHGKTTLWSPDSALMRFELVVKNVNAKSKLKAWRTEPCPSFSCSKHGKDCKQRNCVFFCG